METKNKKYEIILIGVKPKDNNVALQTKVIDELKNTPPGKGNEIWIVDAIENYIKNGGEMYAKEIEGGEWLTTGDPFNYLKCILKYAIDREDIGGDLKKFLKNL